MCPYSGIFSLSVNSFLKPLSPYFPLPCSALDWTWGKGIKDVFIQYITKLTKVQSHVSLKNLELVKSNSANGIIRTQDWLTCRVKEVFYDHDHFPFVNIYCRASYIDSFCHLPPWNNTIRLIDFWCFNATFNNISDISWRPVLVVEEAGIPGENHRPWASNW